MPVSYFINYEKKQTEEKCPICGEEFLEHKGGAQCPYSCSDKQVEEKHQLVAQPMVNYCLADYDCSANVDCPSTPLTEQNYNDIVWGWTTLYNKTITIPWYTLRSKEEFFDTIPHEVAHITSTELKFPSIGDKKIIAEYQQLEDEYNNLSTLHKHSLLGDNYQKLLRKYYRENKVLIKNWKSGIHGSDYWHTEYVRLHGELMNSSYSIYNYYGSSPKNRRKSWEF